MFLNLEQNAVKETISHWETHKLGILVNVVN